MGNAKLRKVSLFIAQSLDGYIADKNGSVDWLGSQVAEQPMPDVYSEFIQAVDTVIMGYKTYEQVSTQLSPDNWPYSGMKTYVLTHRKIKARPEISFVKEALPELIERLQQQAGKKIWLCGGANLVKQALQSNLIEEYYLSIMPIVLGDGIRLFDQVAPSQKLKLLQTKTYNGIVDLHYVKC